MSDTAEAAQDTGPDIIVRIARPQTQIDFVTILGLIFAIGLIVFAIAIGQSNANFFNIPAIMIVVFGTMAVTSISYSGAEIARTGQIIAQSFFKRVTPPKVMARQLMDVAALARKRGLLSLSSIESELNKDKPLAEAVQILTDGYSPEDLERVLSQDMDALVERHRRSASILRRAAEVAPAMGLIGTLVGLVQMLADLENPENIGPAMAVALLTTFYGAILGTAVLGPLAAKLERNSNDETLLRSLIRTAISSIARQENPRRLEMLLNSELPPAEKIRYFD